MPQSDDMRPARLWRSMPTDQRVSAAAAFWRDEQAALEQAEAVALIARHIKFRPKSVLALPVEKKAKHLATMAQVLNWSWFLPEARESPSCLASGDGASDMVSLPVSRPALQG